MPGTFLPDEVQTGGFHFVEFLAEPYHKLLHILITQNTIDSTTGKREGERNQVFDQI